MMNDPWLYYLFSYFSLSSSFDAGFYALIGHFPSIAYKKAQRNGFSIRLAECSNLLSPPYEALL